MMPLRSSQSMGTGSVISRDVARGVQGVPHDKICCDTLRLLQDVVAPKTTMEVKVFMQQSKDITAAAAAECKDKFLIQSTPVPADWVRFRSLF